MAYLFSPHYQALDANGDPLSGAKLYFYQVGTTTSITTYQDVELTSPHADPVVADASGRFAPIYTNVTPFKTKLDTSADVTVQTVQTVYGITGNFSVIGSDVVSDASLALGPNGDYFDVTGTTTITSIDARAVGGVVRLHFDGILTLTHHATNLILPGGANITTAAGDEFTFVEYASGDWRCTGYALASGTAVTSSGGDLLSTNNLSDVANAATSRSNLGAGDFLADGTVAMTGGFDAGGNGLANVGAIGLTGGQIAFPSTQVPSADANTLDDYEEGTYTPTWSSSGTAVDLGNGVITGTYTKNGNVVKAEIKLIMGSTTTFGSGEYYLTLPFTAADATGLGTARANDSGSRGYAGISQAFSTTQVRCLGDVGGGANWGAAVPHTWANTDIFQVTIPYTV